jgi:hypothetical protein
VGPTRLAVARAALNLPAQRPIRRALKIPTAASTPAMRRAVALVPIGQGWAGVLMVHAMACASVSVLAAERPRTMTGRSALTSTPASRLATVLRAWADGGWVDRVGAVSDPVAFRSAASRRE